MAIVAHYDPRGGAAPHLLRQLEQIGDHYDDVVLASPVVLDDEAATAISERATLVRRPNYGHDFGSWRDVLERFDWAQDYDQLLLTNDSYVGFFRPLDEVIDSMSKRPVEMWGMTRTARVSPHVQSYFMHFTAPALHSQAFRRFWMDISPASDRMGAILGQEVGISRAILSAGYRIGSYFEPTRSERLRAGRRGAHWLHKRQQQYHTRFGGPHDEYFSARKLRDPNEADRLNWSSVFADSTLDRGRLPVIKLDVLRHDPYWLGAAALLQSLEARYPLQMQGVRDYLEETTPLYAKRQFENHGSTRLNVVEKALFGYRAHTLSSKGRARNGIDS
ncbi:rhamnan synthesis F family protein [Microbacterium sp. YJN-G]|uniref:rhamnan synthesis F family protein n=1 Tax=Microbacterium sp. YJN-G TaxID=2763257 RepID=UPI001877C971|nr:rhamnan synthesis F family protein [Microbacterium sp. YJN-G]